MRRSTPSLALFVALACGGAGEAEPTPAEPRRSPAPAPALEDGALSIPDPWPTLAPVVGELVEGELVAVEESWSIGAVSGEVLASLRIRSLPRDRAAAFTAGCDRLEDHDPRYSLSRTAMSARVGEVSIRLSTPAFFPGELHVDASIGSTRQELVTRCRALAPLTDELAALDAWPASAQGCSRTRPAEGSVAASVELTVDEATARAFLSARGFVERPSELDVEVHGRELAREGDRPARARYLGSRGALTLFVGGDVVPDD